MDLFYLYGTIKNNITCDCNEAKRTMNRSIEMCPNSLFKQEIIGTHRVIKEAIEWLNELNLNLQNLN